MPPPAPPLGPPPPGAAGGGDRSRAGARWITGVGAFLLLAAATVFVAVRWNEIADEVKLGILAACTGGFLLAGRRTREALPGTSGALYHLGAFLVPLNTAAIAIGRDLAWPPFLLLEGVTAAASWFVLNRIEHSKVLSWATTAAVVVAVAGTSATMATALDWSVPAAVLLGAAALAAELLRRHGAALAWALLAGLAPVLALAERALPGGRDVLSTLGLAGEGPRLGALVSGALSAVVLARNARRRNDLLLVVCSAVAAGLGLLTAWIGLDPSTGTHLMGAAALFLVVEIAVHAVRTDPLWGRPAAWFAGAVELIAGVSTVVATCVVFGHALTRPGVTSARDAVAGLLATVAWFVADLRRRHDDGSGVAAGLLLGAGWWPATVGLSAGAIVATIAATGIGVPVALVSIALAGVLVISGRGGAHVLAGALAIAAPAFAHDAGWLVLMGIGAAGAVVVATAAVVRAQLGAEHDVLASWGLAITSPVPVLMARAIVVADNPIVAGSLDGVAVAIIAVLALWLVAAVLDLGEHERDRECVRLGMVGRVASLLVVVSALGLAPSRVALVAGIAAALAVLDAVRRDDADPLYPLVVSLPLTVGMAAWGLTHDVAHAGLAQCGLAAVAVGAVLLAPRRFMDPLAILAATSALLGVLLTAGNPSAFSTAAIMLGGIGLALTVAYAVEVGAVFAWILVTIGVWGHLSQAQVNAIDAYVAPVAIALVVAGERAMRKGSTRVSSWIAFGPAIALLAGTALVERVSGGHGVHALVAGAVGMGALLVGGTRRLIAPLLLGTVVLVAVTAHESLSVTRQVPTWGWLALGGTVLLTVGAVMDRRETGPIESGKRLVDAVHERFT